MIKRYLSPNRGFTLVELIAVLAIVMVIIVIGNTVIFSVFNFNEKSSLEIKLEQEANVIISDIRKRHHSEDTYEICYDQLLSNNDLVMQLKLNSETISQLNSCVSQINPEEDLSIELTLTNSLNKSITIENTITGRNTEIIVLERKADDGFYEYLRDNNVFIYSSEFVFKGNQVSGPEASIIIKGNLNTNQMNGGALNQTSNIYVDGNINLDGGSAGLGSKSFPGKIVVNGDLTLWEGTREIYGDVFVNGNLKLKDAVLNGNVYVNGDVELNWTPNIKGNSNIFYTGKLTHPNNYSENILRKVIKKDQVTLESTPTDKILTLRDEKWFSENGYVEKVTSNQNVKLYGTDIKIDSGYSHEVDKYLDTFTNFIIVSTGDITIGGNSWINKFSGVLIAPNGRVSFNGSSFEGIVIAKEGFSVRSGGTKMEYLHIDDYFKSANEFPLLQ